MALAMASPAHHPLPLFTLKFQPTDFSRPQRAHLMSVGQRTCISNRRASATVGQCAAVADASVRNLVEGYVKLSTGGRPLRAPLETKVEIYEREEQFVQRTIATCWRGVRTEVAWVDVPTQFVVSIDGENLYTDFHQTRIEGSG